MNCIYCDEPILAEDSVYTMADPNQKAHRECIFRMVSGSVAHIEGRCRCADPASDCTDPPGMTKREAAKAAQQTWRRRHNLPEDMTGSGRLFVIPGKKECQ
jgi:hypothetical protein